MSVTVRAPTREDLMALGALLQPLPLFTAYGFTAATLSARWTDALAKGESFRVAADGDALLGLCWFSRLSTFSTGAYLRTLAVVPGAQNRGVGALLLEAFEEASWDPPGGWFLLASDFNDGAHRFYARHGYREVGRLPGFAKAGTTEVIFWKPLPPHPH